MPLTWRKSFSTKHIAPTEMSDVIQYHCICMRHIIFHGQCTFHWCNTVAVILASIRSHRTAKTVSILSQFTTRVPFVTCPVIDTRDLSCENHIIIGQMKPKTNDRRRNTVSIAILASTGNGQCAHAAAGIHNLAIHPLHPLKRRSGGIPMRRSERD